MLSKSIQTTFAPARCISQKSFECAVPACGLSEGVEMCPTFGNLLKKAFIEIFVNVPLQGKTHYFGVYLKNNFISVLRQWRPNSSMIYKAVRKWNAECRQRKEPRRSNSKKCQDSYRLAASNQHIQLDRNAAGSHIYSTHPLPIPLLSEPTLPQPKHHPQ